MGVCLFGDGCSTGEIGGRDGRFMAIAVPVDALASGVAFASALQESGLENRLGS